MLKNKCLLGVLFVLFGQVKLSAQLDTTLVLQEVLVQKTAIRNENVGGKNDVIYKGGNSSSLDLTSLLNLEGGLYIKSYGSNSLGTSSIRGGSAGHTLLLWNGIPLQSPTLGLLDLSLIPVSLMDKINVQKGGNSALWGSGAIGGVINLENKIGSDTYLEGNLRYGSFGNLVLGLELGYGQDGFYGKTKISYSQAENNFQYRVADNLPLKELVNAAFNTMNINQDLYFSINDKQYIEMHYWWQNSMKEIPPTLTQNFNESFQEDQANRMIITWNRTSDNHKSYIKLAVLDEKQRYTDPIIRLVSDNNFTQWFGEAGHTIQIKRNQKISAGITAVETAAKTNGYSNKITETKLGFWLSHQLKLGKLKLQSSIREEWVEKKWIPVTPSLGIQYQLHKLISLNSKISRNYRLPTLNDQFWKPGGNVNLLPENGWSQEIGLCVNSKKVDHQLAFELTTFNRNIKNWILWTPSSEFGFWTAQNITEVWSRGIESSIMYGHTYKSGSLSVKFNYNYIKSTNEVAIDLPKLEVGQQLIYTPEHQASGNVSFRYKKWGLSYQHLFTGKNQGANDNIPAYHLGNVRTDYKTNYNKSDINFFVQVQNIWNADYIVVERRPMPGINFQLGINFKIK